MKLKKGNPYLNPENPYLDEKSSKVGVRELYPLALQLLKMKNKGNLKLPEWRFGETKPGEVLAVEGQPTVALEDVPKAAETVTENVAESAAEEATGAEGLDAFALGEEAAAEVAAEEAGTLVEIVEGLDAFDFAAGTEGITEGLSAFELTPLAEAGGVSAGMGGAGEAASGITAGMGGAGEAGALGASEAGATLGSVAGGAASALPWYALLKAGSPILRNIMQTGTEDLTGADADSSNVLQKMNKAAMSTRGAVTPLYEEFTGKGMPWYGELFSNPAGFVFGKVLGCIIISACTSPDSYEVEIARKYRDRYMTLVELTGYYALCPHVAPLIHKYPMVKKIVKKVLVDRLVDYGAWKLGLKDKMKYRTSGAVKTMFLGLCRLIGWAVGTALQEG